MKKYVALLVCTLLVLAGCAARESQELPSTQATETSVPQTTAAATQPTVKSREETNIWILLPDEQSLRWREAGEDLQMLLSNLCYPVQLAYAGSDAREQARQMTDAIDQGADCLIVAPVESAALMQAQQAAAESGIPVFSYDRLLMDAEAVSYYVSFDYRAIGVAIGQHIVTERALDLVSEENALTIEFFMGSPEDNNALLLYRGIMDALRPYLEKGILVSKSGRTAFEDTCMVDWDPQVAEDSLKSYMGEYYGGKSPDILCTVSDDFAAACARVLADAGIRQMPLITGMGATEEGVQNVTDGVQSMTVQTDLYQLDDRCVQLVDDVLSGKEPELNDTENCNNNVKTVPAYLCEFSAVTLQELIPEESHLPE